MFVIIVSIMAERAESIFSLTPSPFTQLEAMLHAGDKNGDGYVFDHYPIPEAHLEVDRLRYPANGTVNVVLRQAVLAPKQQFATMPFEGEAVKLVPIEGDIVADLVAARPDQPLRIECTDGSRSSIGIASWGFTPSGRVSWSMPHLSPSRSPISPETLRQHLGWIFGSAALLGTTLPRLISER
jgi:hypothetical protein